MQAVEMLGKHNHMAYSPMKVFNNFRVSAFNAFFYTKKWIIITCYDLWLEKHHLIHTENYRNEITRQVQLYKTLISIFSWSHVAQIMLHELNYYWHNPISHTSWEHKLLPARLALLARNYGKVTCVNTRKMRKWLKF